MVLFIIQPASKLSGSGFFLGGVGEGVREGQERELAAMSRSFPSPPPPPHKTPSRRACSQSNYYAVKGGSNIESVDSFLKCDTEIKAF